MLSVAVGRDYIREGEDFLAPVIAATDEVVVMAYYDNRDDIISESSVVAQWVQDHDKQMWIAVETQDLEGNSRGNADQTFYEEGWEFMEGELSNVQEHFSSEETFGGMAIHHYKSYRFMKKLPEGRGS